MLLMYVERLWRKKAGETLESSRQLQYVRINNKIIEGKLKGYSLASWASYVEGMALVDHDLSEDIYYIFTFELVQNLFFRFSKLAKFRIIQYIYSNVLSTNPFWSRSERNLFTSNITLVLQDCKSLQSNFQNYYTIPV